MDVSSDLIRELMDIGMLAAYQGLCPQAQAIFNAVRAVRPDSEIPYIGHGIAFLNANRAKHAIMAFEGALQKNPDSGFAKCYLGMACKMTGAADRAEQLLNEVISDSGDQEAVVMAENFLALEKPEPAFV